MSIKITIKEDSKAGRMFKKYMTEKAAFRNAVKTGTVSEYTQKRNVKFDSPVSINR